MTNVRLEVEDLIAEIRFDRPQKMNAVTPEMADAIAEICREVDRREDVRVVMLTGAGDKAFCAGSDLNALAKYPSAWAFRNRTEYATAFRDIRKPVVAALKGWVLGGGAEIALSADIRVADETARIGFPEVKHGWVGGGGASQMLPRLCGYGQAMRLLLTGDIIDVAEARTLGFVEDVVPAGEAETAARALCTRIAAHVPVATEAVKASVRMGIAAGLDSGLRYENEMNTLCFTTGDHTKGIQAFQRKKD
ncbi:MAG: enoyl-CoA hydratase/isomerase family protein [Acuticoccus sp.]